MTATSNKPASTTLWGNQNICNPKILSGPIFLLRGFFLDLKVIDLLGKLKKDFDEKNQSLNEVLKRLFIKNKKNLWLQFIFHFRKDIKEEESIKGVNFLVEKYYKILKENFAKDPEAKNMFVNYDWKQANILMIRLMKNFQQNYMTLESEDNEGEKLAQSLHDEINEVLEMYNAVKIDIKKLIKDSLLEKLRLFSVEALKKSYKEELNYKINFMDENLNLDTGVINQAILALGLGRPEERADSRYSVKVITIKDKRIVI